MIGTHNYLIPCIPNAFNAASACCFGGLELARAELRPRGSGPLEDAPGVCTGGLDFPLILCFGRGWLVTLGAGAGDGLGTLGAGAGDGLGDPITSEFLGLSSCCATDSKCPCTWCAASASL